MALITVHLFNSINQQEALVINTDHIVSVQMANDNSANIQMTSGPVFRTTESVAELADLVDGNRAYVPPALETKFVELEAPIIETAAEKKARIKAEADAAAQ